MEEEKNEKGFVIKDRRLFDESGEVRTETGKKGEETTATATGAGADENPDTPKDESAEEDYSQIPEINFAGFIYSLATTAFYHFGDFPDPATNKTSRNLAAARQTIDILTMLQEKTAGNLEQGEKKLMDDLLYELRLRYVKEAEGK